MVPVNTDPSLRSRQIPGKFPFRFLLDLILHSLIQSCDPPYKPNQTIHTNPSLSIKFHVCFYSTMFPQKRPPAISKIRQTHIPV